MKYGKRVLEWMNGVNGEGQTRRRRQPAAAHTVGTPWITSSGARARRRKRNGENADLCDTHRTHNVAE